jgi:LmbE family N-acetylglucosaminyl deacetylase
MTQNKTILSVLAHPDDESFGMGGTLALYAQKGCDVYLVCATRGEVGDVDPEHMKGFSSIAELREGELRCAAGHLGLKGVFFSITAIQACPARRIIYTPMHRLPTPWMKLQEKWSNTSAN